MHDTEILLYFQRLQKKIWLRRLISNRLKPQTLQMRSGSSGTSVNYKIKYKPRNTHLIVLNLKFYYVEKKIFSAHIIRIGVCGMFKEPKCVKQNREC